MKKVWYRQLGFFNNPFSIKPAAFTDDVFGYDDIVREMEKGIVTNKLMFLEGKFGEGKTTILKRLLRDFGGQKKVIYFSCNRMEGRLKVRKLLNERYGTLGRWFDIKPKDMILFLDEVQEMELKDTEKVLKYFQDGHFKSILFVGVKYEAEKYPAELQKNLRVFSLPQVTVENAVAIVRKRVGNLPLLPDDAIKEIFKRSSSNIRTLLKNCETLCRHTVMYGNEKVTKDLIDELLGKKAEEKIVVTEENAKDWADVELEVEEEKPEEGMDDVDVADVEEEEPEEMDEVEKELENLTQAKVEAKKPIPQKKEHFVDEEYY